jgi:hypothetical protein
MDVAEGSNFTGQGSEPGCESRVIGQTVAENLFKGESPIGKMICFNSIPL